MRKLLLSLAVLGGIAAAGSGTAAAFPAALPGPVLHNQTQVENVQYWRERRFERHRAWQYRRALRHDMWRARHAGRDGYYRRY